MTVNASRAKFIPDYDASVLLRNIADGAETATATETSVSLRELDTAWWHDGNDIPGGVFEVNVHITAAKVSVADEAYTLDLIVDDASAMNDTPRVVAGLIFPAGTALPGVYRMFVASDQIKLLNSDTSGTDKYLAVRLTAAGTSPSITYGAFLSKVRGA